MSAYLGAVTIRDKRGRQLRAFAVTTMERACGHERLGFALVAARSEELAERRVRHLWPDVRVVDVAVAP